LSGCTSAAAVDCSGAVVVLAAESELLHVVDARTAPRRFPRRLDGRQEQADERPDDRDHHEEFDEREPLPGGASWSSAHGPVPLAEDVEENERSLSPWRNVPLGAS
jgi:hypothetical protein